MERMIELAGKNYALRYTVNSMCAVEERAGRPLDALMRFEYSAVRLLLWGGLIEGRPELTPTDAGELMTAYIHGGGTLEAIAAACEEALKEAGFLRPPAAEETAAASATAGSR